MSLFVEYIQPFTNWLLENPHWALFFAFLISLSESLAIIGSIIPGSVTMTAIGILAGSGIMRIDLTLTAAVLGAIVGDGLSYALGYFYSEKISDIWPFSKYPTWLQYGKEFFNRHGGKSIILGRFIGPLRSIIPVIAGVMHMKKWRFIIANIISALFWCLVYVMPGILIGAASHELSAESSTRLIIFILLLLALIWSISWIIKWVLVWFSKYLRSNLHDVWYNFKKHPVLFTLFNLVTPKDEQHHYNTAVLVLSTILTLVLFIVFLVLSIQVEWYPSYNIPLHLLMQSFLTPSLAVISIICTQLTSTITIFTVYLFCCVWFSLTKCGHSVKYFTMVLIISTGIAVLLAYLFPTAKPQDFIIEQQGSSLPPINLLVATAFYSFLVFVINNRYSLLTNALNGSIVVLLGLSGFAALYLGDYWFSDILLAYFAGLSIFLIHALWYRKKPADINEHNGILIGFIISIILVATAIDNTVYYKTLRLNHVPYQKEYSLMEKNWWDQQHPILPIYILNRIGQRFSLLNIQYSGDLDDLKSSLKSNGWSLHTESFITKVVQRMTSENNQIKLPLLDILFDNKQPELLMTFTTPDSSLIFELRMWESNYYLRNLGSPIWIGSVHLNKTQVTKQLLKKSSTNQFNDPLTYLLPALDHFTVRRIEVPKSLTKSTIIPTSPFILLIKK